MKCKLCTGNNSYVGETGRKVRTRYNEHLADARYEREETAWGEHWRNHHHSIDPRPDDISIKILKKQINDIRDRKIYESIEIRNRNPNINTQQSSWGMLHWTSQRLFIIFTTFHHFLRLISSTTFSSKVTTPNETDDEDFKKRIKNVYCISCVFTCSLLSIVSICCDHGV